MTLAAEQWLDARAAASWRLTPGLELALDAAETRGRLYAVLPEPPPQHLHGLIVALTHREMRYRRALWDEGIEEGNGRYESLSLRVDGEWRQWQSGWERRQSEYYWPI